MDQHLEESFNRTLFESDDSCSEFDEFEHHLSNYENQDDEQDEQMEHDGDQSQIDDCSDHQISLATSFCHNTQEQNADFLDDKFNGDLLVENFSEDKFIRCKYSEDFVYEQHCNQIGQANHVNSEQFENEDLFSLDKQKTIEERSSEDEHVIKNRKQHFLEFISTLPKVCTPSVCGTMSQETSIRDQMNRTEKSIRMDRIMEMNEETRSKDADKFKYNDFMASPVNDESPNEHENFDWSIDQIATLNPVDISFDERRFLRFKDFEADQLTQEKLTKENDLFFSQETIAPSPHKRVSFTNIGSEFHSFDWTDSLHAHGQESSKHANANEGKDSGNYSVDDEDEYGDSNNRLSYTNHSKANSRMSDFELSFIKHSNRRLSKIEFDEDLKCNRKGDQQTETPIKRRSIVNHAFDKTRPTEWAGVSKFVSDCTQQTSTPCTSMLRSNLAHDEQQSIECVFNDSQLTKESDKDDHFLRKPSFEKRNKAVPLQERNFMRQKKRLFHNLSSSNNEFITCLNLSSNEGSTADNSISSHKSLTTTRDNQVDEEDSCKEVTFGSSTSSVMSVCDNNSLTPRLKKSRSSLMAKSFAERLNEIEFFGNNDENNSPLFSSNAQSTPSGNETPNVTKNSMPNKLTDSNCFAMCKNFNNLLNNSDSGCFLMSASSSNSGLTFDLKKRPTLNSQ